MSPMADAVMRSWSLDWSVLGPVSASVFVYTVGWRRCARRSPRYFRFRELASFWGGMFCILAALASPIEPFADLLLSVHMAQHLLLMMAAPPLLWLGAPLLPLLFGLPTTLRRTWIGPWFRMKGLRRTLGWLASPTPAWCLFTACNWLWHWPPAYELALRDRPWHYAEHSAFLAAALLFWHPVVLPHPARASWSRWQLIPYLLTADVANTALSAILTFSDRVLYAHYERVPSLGDWTPLADQALAGVLMWTFGSLSFLLPTGIIGYELLTGSKRKVRETPLKNSPIDAPKFVRLPILGPGLAVAEQAPKRFDLLATPVVGSLLRRRSTRTAIQAATASLAALFIFDGLFGPAAAGMNLAGVLPWIHWRGLVVVGLILVGNVFCYACPFTLADRWTQRRPGAWAWPRVLRNKWIPLALILLFFWSYEVFSLWADPRATAAIALAYFAAALAVNGLFRGLPFCKYVCPIGQFHFTQSTLSPFEVQCKDRAVCRECVGNDCIRGNAATPGCAMGLYLPHKSGNLDCTFCLDCVAACPSGNVGLLAVPPGADPTDDRRRAGIGRLSERWDLAATTLVLVAAAFVNAAMMVAPVLEWEDALAMRLGLATRFIPATTAIILATTILPLLAAGAAAWSSKRWSGDRRSLLESGSSMVYCLVPIGLAMWAAHYLFHFLTSFGVVVPVFQRFVGDLGIESLGEPAWQYACCAPVANWLLKLEIVLLDVGLVASVVVGYRIQHRRGVGARRSFKGAAPWWTVALALFLFGVWIVLQPMEMRGTLTPGG